MGVEIENLIESSIGVALPPTSLMRARTIGQIASLISEHLGGGAEAAAAAQGRGSGRSHAGRRGGCGFALRRGHRPPARRDVRIPMPSRDADAPSLSSWMQPDNRARLKQWLESGEARLQPLTFPQRELWETFAGARGGSGEPHLRLHRDQGRASPPKECRGGPPAGGRAAGGAARLLPAGQGPPAADDPRHRHAAAALSANSPPPRRGRRRSRK